MGDDDALKLLFHVSNSHTLENSLDILIQTAKSDSGRSKRILPALLTILQSQTLLIDYNILSLCFKLLRNLCAGELVNQNLFLEFDGVVIVVSRVLRLEDGSDPMLVRWGLQVLANVCLAGKQHQRAIWEELFPFGFVSLARLGSKEVCDPLCMVIYTCCDGNPEWFGELCSDTGWPVVVELVRTASSASFGEDWIKLILSRICLEESQLPELFSKLRLKDIHEGEDGDSKDDQFSSEQAFLLQILSEILNERIEDVTVSKDVALFVYGIFKKYMGVLEHSVRGKSGLPTGITAVDVLGYSLTILRDICANDSARCKAEDANDVVDVLLSNGLIELLLIVLGDLEPPAIIRKGIKQSENQDGASSSSKPCPYKGFRRDIVALVGNCVYKRKHAQDELRNRNGVLLLLQQCVTDEDNPFLREWGIWSVRNMLEGNEENQKVVSELQLQGSADMPEISALGLRVENAEDNHYNEGVKPRLEFVITSDDITDTGAPATLLIFNNEKGFSPKNIESICSVGRSTKKGNRSSGYIGEKGIGFKSVFLVTAQPDIFSNEYQIRFNEKPCLHCSLGYIVPEWVEEKPTLADIKKIYGQDILPATTIVLPLKSDKVNPVKQQLSNVHPEVLLFLTKIRQLSVREVNENPTQNTVTAVSISSEIDFMTRKNMNAESYTLHLSAEENSDDEMECSYYMWKQKFPVRFENMVERRTDVEEWVVTLAFPNQERLHRGKSSPGVYAFLPTEMVTNFPFIIQADFVLASSRETILLDNKWNQGILECVPSAFMDAFKTLVIGSDQAPVSSLARMFKFLPVESSPFEKFNHVRDKIKAKLLEENIIPIETYTEQKHFYKPGEVCRLLPEFWDILNKARDEGVYLLNLSSHDGRKILSSSFDTSEYDQVLNFLGVKFVDVDWYAKCIQSSNLVDGVSEELYLQLLLFVAKNWSSKFKGTDIDSIPLIKYVALDGTLSSFSLYECSQRHAGAKRVVIADSSESNACSWLINWNKEFACAANRFFIPESTQKAFLHFPQKQTLMEWLVNQVYVTDLSVYTFAKVVCSSVKNNRKHAIAYAHFLYHSLSKAYLTKREVDTLCNSMPLVDNYGSITERREGVLVPANVSKWADLIVSNPWRNEDYVELGKDYLNASFCAGQFTDSGKLINFLKTHVGASDIPYISPPNAGFSAVDTPLTKDNAFLLLDWIRNLRYKGVHLPKRFLECIKEGSWLKNTVNGYRPPSKSFLIRSPLGKILQTGSVLVDIPLIDESFYGDRIITYEEELKTIGVMSSCEEACNFIGKELMTRASSFTLSKNHVLLMLNFIRYLRGSLLPLDKFVNSIKDGPWLKTSWGYRSPKGSVLNDSEWKVASEISNIPFIDQSYFGYEIYNYKEELKLLGVIVGLSGNYQTVIKHLKSPAYLASLTAEAVLLTMHCMRLLNDSSKVSTSLKGTSCLKTNMGFKKPSECFLYDPVWGCILDVFSGLPVIDHKFYGEKIFSYKAELRKIDVVVDFEDAIKKFASLFKQKASQTSFDKDNVISFLSCCRKLKGTEYRFPPDFSTIIHNQKWLYTKVGCYACPKKCILYGPEWKSISSITCLPFIDDSDRFYGTAIHGYREELKNIGVVTELKQGLSFVPKCLNFPSNTSTITPESVFSLLECIRSLLSEKKLSIDDEFKNRLSRNWLKTHAGYRPPETCLLFDSKWSSFFSPTDGPFIDANFYGPEIASFQRELNAVGVIIDLENGCTLLSNHLDSLSNTDNIVKIYRYLSEYNWKPEKQDDKKIWISNGTEGGKWVNSEECVIHDPDKLFSLKFYVLEDIYDKKILPFLTFSMEVRTKPSLDDYVDLWNVWERSSEELSNDKCWKFWMFIMKHLSTSTEKKLSDRLIKLPVSTSSHEIFLVDKEDAFIPDNLHLKKLFEQEKIFVCYPQQNFGPSSIAKLYDIYRKIGARNISESLCKEQSSFVNDNDVEMVEVDPNNIFNLKGLVKLILSFLASSSLKMEPEKRHEAVQGLLNLSFLKTMVPVTASYSLSLSSGDIITKKDDKMVRWDKQSSKFFIHKMDEPERNALKYATYFCETISEGVLSENHDCVPALSELITLGFVLKFKNEDIEFLMESKNLQIFCEDEKFLSSAFPSD